MKQFFSKKSIAHKDISIFIKEFKLYSKFLKGNGDYFFIIENGVAYATLFFEKISFSLFSPKYYQVNRNIFKSKPINTCSSDYSVEVYSVEVILQCDKCGCVCWSTSSKHCNKKPEHKNRLCRYTIKIKQY